MAFNIKNNPVYKSVGLLYALGVLFISYSLFYRGIGSQDYYGLIPVLVTAVFSAFALYFLFISQRRIGKLSAGVLVTSIVAMLLILLGVIMGTLEKNVEPWGAFVALFSSLPILLLSFLLMIISLCKKPKI